MPFAHLRILSVIAFTCLYTASPAMSATRITLDRPVKQHAILDVPIDLPAGPEHRVRLEISAMERSTWTAAKCTGNGNYALYLHAGPITTAVPFQLDSNGRTEFTTPAIATPPTAVHVRIDVLCRTERPTSVVATTHASVVTESRGVVEAVGNEPYTLPSGLHSTVTVADRIDFGNVRPNSVTEWVPVFENFTGEQYPNITVNGFPIMTGGTSTRAEIAGEFGVVSINGWNAQYTSSGSAGQENLVLHVNLSIP